MPIDPTKVAARVKPFAGEDQPSFAIRFHESMRSMVPDTQSRNRMMFSAWGDHDGMAAAAEESFPAEKYQRVTSCEFKEHVARNGDGSQSVYSRDELAMMARNMNRRIADTGNYGTITDGHTPEKSTDPMPDVLGHRGPYFLGQIGQQTARWAIFSTEHANHANANTLKARPTRSAEVWRSPREADRIIEPLAALGAEAPRLDLGTVRYTRSESGQSVERYMAAAMPGPMSTHITGGRDKYAENEPEPVMMDENGGGLTDQDVQAISNRVVEALEESPQWQFINSIMTSQDDSAEAAEPELGGSAEPEIVNDASEVIDDAPPAFGDAPDAPQSAPEAGNTDPAPAPEPPAAMAPEPMPEPSPEPAPEPMPALESGPESEPFGAMAPEPASEPSVGEDHGEEIAALKREIESLKQQVAAMSSGSPVEQYRRERWLNLREKGFPVDIDREMEMVVDYSPDQFERYAARFESTHDRIPLADTVGPTPTGDLPTDPLPAGTSPDMERYSKAAASYSIQRQRAGESVSFKDALMMAQDPHDTRITV